MNQTKVCTGCKLEKPFDAFTADASKADGKHTRCKMCRSQSDKISYQRREQERAEAEEAAIREELRSSLISQANRNAMILLIQNHQTEFITLRERELHKLSVERAKPSWKNAGAPTKEMSESWVEKVREEIPIST